MKNELIDMLVDNHIHYINEGRVSFQDATDSDRCAIEMLFDDAIPAELCDDLFACYYENEDLIHAMIDIKINSEG